MNVFPGGVSAYSDPAIAMNLIGYLSDRDPNIGQTLAEPIVTTGDLPIVGLNWLGSGVNYMLDALGNVTFPVSPGTAPPSVATFGVGFIDMSNPANPTYVDTNPAAPGNQAYATLSGVTSQWLGTTNFYGAEIHSMSGAFSNKFTLPAGSYLVELFADTSGSVGEAFVWQNSYVDWMNGYNGPGPGKPTIIASDGTFSSTFYESNMALQIVVPEPSRCSLILFAVCMLCLKRKR